jgi:hypothetical protein
MHPVNCPTCGKRIEVDFLPVAGQVWCPSCQRAFSRRAVSEPTHETDRTDPHAEQNDGAG